MPFHLGSAFSKYFDIALFQIVFKVYITMICVNYDILININEMNNRMSI